MSPIIRNKYFCVLVISDVLLLIAGLIYIFAFPDFDTDAYAHHCISREIYLGNTNLNINWVWLPLFHYIQVVMIALGLTMQSLRFFNLGITFIIPLVLFFWLNKKDDKELPYSESFISSIICLLFPILILMGTTAQPEPIFCLIILIFAISFVDRKYLISSFFLTLAVLWRYEAWILPLAIIVFVIWSYIFRKREIPPKNLKISNLILTTLFPFVAMGIWTVARHQSDGTWFGFIFVTQGFANEVLKSSSSFDSGILQFIWDVFYYPLIVPYYLAGPIVILAYFGIKRTVQKQNSVWVIFYSLILLFLTITWIKKSSLGLHRHFAVLVPFYSILIVNGIPSASVLICNINSKLKKSVLSYEEQLNKIKKILVVLLIISQIIVTTIWSIGWLNYTGKLFVERYQTADFLINLPGDKYIFCDEASVEVLSRLDMRIFNRVWLENKEADEMITDASKKNNNVYIVTWDRKMKRYLEFGEIIFKSSPDYNTKETLQVLKVKAK